MNLFGGVLSVLFHSRKGTVSSGRRFENNTHFAYSSGNMDKKFFVDEGE